MAEPTRLLRMSGAREQLDALPGDAGQVLAVADQLFAVGALLDGNGGLRRALSDPARPAAAKAELSRSLLGTQVSGETLAVLDALTAQRWPTAGALADAVERAGAEAAVVAADRAGRLDALEDDLFRFRRILQAEPALATAVADGSAPLASREALVTGLLEQRVGPEGLRLVLQAVRHPRGRRVDSVLDLYGKVAATRRDQLVARVVSAVALTDAERERLAAALSRTYGRSVSLRAEVDPGVLGGLRVQVGDEVVDGTVATRLDEVRQRLAG
jgi:F-type H+-transporting ATPase subunit delta